VFNFPNIKIGTNGNDTLNGQGGMDFIFGFSGQDVLKGRDGNDVLAGGSGDDLLSGGMGHDRLYGGTGNDKLFGGQGNDDMFGGKGNDNLTGGSGNDDLWGGSGVDRFLFDPSNESEGHDDIKDFAVGTDKIVLNAADILIGDPDIITKSGDVDLLDATDFDADDDWDVEASHDGDVLIVHPTGTIELDGIDFGASTDSFADLLPALELTGVVAGGAGADHLAGGSGKDAIFGLAGADTLEGKRGHDALVGGDGADKFIFNPDRMGEGDDVILDFELGTDKIVLSVEDVLASTPGLLALAGDPNAFEPEDLDASDLWDLSASDDGDLLVTHPNGTIELIGVAFADGITFRDILPALELV
jgi:Ca2+-binding RTX toxin-like protein